MGCFKAADQSADRRTRCETGGAQPKDCAIVKAAFRAAELLGIEPEYRYESSTDANIPISMGIPAITVGRGGEEDGIHTLQEWYEPKKHGLDHREICF